MCCAPETAYALDGCWSSDVCSSDLVTAGGTARHWCCRGASTSNAAIACSSGDRLNKMCDVLLEARDSQLRLDRTFRQRGQRDGSPTVGAAAERATGDVRSVRASAEIHNKVHLDGRGGEGRGGEGLQPSPPSVERWQSQRSLASSPPGRRYQGRSGGHHTSTTG